MTIKLMFIVSTLEKVGPINQLFYLIKFLDKNLFEIKIITLSPESKNSNYNLFKKNNIKIESLFVSKLSGFFLINFRLNKINEQWKPDIIQSLGFRSDRVKIKQQIPKIISLRTASPEVARPILKWPHFLGKLLATSLHKFHLRTMAQADLVIACSKSLYKSNLNNFNKDKFKFIQNGVDIDLYKPLSRALRKKNKRKLGFQETKKIFISIGSLNTGKNTDLTIRAFMNENQFNLDCHLIILGQGPLYNKYKIMTNSYNNISLLGEKKNVLEYLQISDFFISSSKGEGLPNSVLEAMSVGVPCILSKIPAHEEILGNDDSGLLFIENNQTDLVKKIKQIMLMNYKKLSFNSRYTIKKYFSAEKMSLEYQKIYKKIYKEKLIKIL